MKFLRLILLSLMLIINSPLFAQQLNWEQIGPDGGDYYDIQKDGIGNLYVNSGYNLYKSTDNGDSWKMINIPYWGYSYRYFTNFFVHGSGKIFIMVDGNSPVDSAYVSDEFGFNWRKSEAIPIQENSNGMLFGLDSENRLRSSYDQGKTWSFFSNPSSSIHTFYFIDRERYVILSKSGVLYTTVDGGKNYKENKFQIGNFIPQFFLDSNKNLFFINTNKFQVSKDFGQTWADVSTPPSVTYFKGIFENNAKELIIGANKELYKSLDGGVSWTKIMSFSSPIANMRMFSNSEFYCLIDNEGIYKQNLVNGNWEKKNTGLYRNLGKIFRKEKLIFLFNFQSLFKSSDFGESWVNVALYEPMNNFIFHQSGMMSFILPGARLIISMDYGAAWKEIQNPKPNSFVELLLINKDYFMCYSSDLFSIFVSTDQGMTWQLKANFDKNYSKPSFAVRNENEVYFARDNKIYRTTNLGNNWTLKHEFQFANNKTISNLFVSPFGQLYATISNEIYDVDLGTKGKLSLPDIGSGDLNIRFSDEGMMFISSWDRLYSSKDFGKSFELLNNHYPEKVYSVVAAGNKIFTITNYPGVLRAKLESLKSIEYSKGLLVNNFPNPFNNLTVVEFYIKYQEHVELKVYDILGNEIESMLAKVLVPGYYRYSWQPQNLPSGVYFYRIQTPSFSETKKMIYLK